MTDTEINITTELSRLQRNDVEGAASLYRKAIERGLAFKGFATTLSRLQDDPSVLRDRLVAIDREIRNQSST